ncbi:INO80 complex subunit C [Brienomyrus brachyistius]|uniref:INO80 complex subunit C n=1 Tax=Brienomyrus brachyistius TaxID=42636 RepID=UPI0020B3AE72|nr:INO80 complex subunit C [Brienomyrus brachyistius]
MASSSSSSGAAVAEITASPVSSGKITASASQSRAKKRPASPAVGPCQGAGSSGNSSKKKKLSFTPSGPQGQAPSLDSPADPKAAAPSEQAALESCVAAKPQPFKDPSFVHSGIGGAAAGKKNRTWKNLKQILAAEKALPWQLNDPNYYNIDAPPSLKPAKKYSDISGLPASYTDPQTKLRFASSEEFSYIRLLPSDVVTGYLALRKASCVVP